MADTRVWNTCSNGATPSGATSACSQIPSIDVVYTDVWTDPVAAGRAKDAAFAYLYADVPTPKPANSQVRRARWRGLTSTRVKASSPLPSVKLVRCSRASTASSILSVLGFVTAL